MLSAVLLISGGLLWVYLAAENERLKACTGNTRHFLKVASPGMAAASGGVAFLIWSLR